MFKSEHQLTHYIKLIYCKGFVLFVFDKVYDF